ncbi:hypothetical protein EYC80_004933 [Monilinia laxa]|uniref:RING-type domain-containing protein n=1 Tax=Monilinia laxa TaxID=61186 RepID=A0A5N6KIJ3_MONLA|nr:hypothetical protein EYC80_004933 [Monilinia laxa]
MEREWWEKLGNAQAQHNEHVPPPQLRPEFPGLLRRYQDGSLVRAIVSLQEQALAPMAQPMPQHMNGNPNAEEIANRVRILEQEEAEIREVEQGLQVRLLALACRREVALRERAAIAREVEEVARRVEEERRAQAAQAARLVEENRTREEVARRAEGERRAQAAQAAAILVEAERQRNEAARRAEEERLIQAEQMRRYEEIMRQQRERAQRALDEQMRIDQALAQQLEEEERSQEAEIQEAERQNAQRREQGLRRIQNRVARMQRFALHAPPPPQQQLQRNPDIAAPPVQIPIQQALEPHVVRRKALEECFACLEPIRAPEDAEWCRAQCGQNICNGCFELWHVNQPVGVLLRCGLCRVIWEWGGL